MNYNKIYEGYLSGCSMKELAAKNNCSYDRIRDNFKKLGFKLRTAGESAIVRKLKREKNRNADWNTIKEEYENGDSLGVLERRYQYSDSTILKNLRKYDTKIRTFSEAQKTSVELGRHIPGNKNKFRDENSNWKGGKRIQVDGRGNKRIMIYHNSKYIPYSQYVWMKYNKTNSIPSGFGVHHIDGNTLNDEISNLILMSISEHSVYHNQKRREEKLSTVV